MTLAAGTRLGPYETHSLLGAGGMGEVYRARDTKLNRDVALKILPDLFAADPERLLRFEREAQTLASLNHPNIAAIHGIEDSTPVRALVLELVEGPTLKDRIAQGRLSTTEALTTARQIALAIEAAHEHGIIHRDLKPANVKIRPDGVIKVLDFGLAKALDSVAALSSASQVSTVPAGLTQDGVVLGTVAYMSPEQATGSPTDERTDIWSFGVVLYEMLTGSPPYSGATTVEILSSVLKAEPQWSSLPEETPAIARVLLHRCLQKDRTQRLRSIADVRFQIEDALRSPLPDSGPSSQPKPTTSHAVRVAAAAVIALALGAILGSQFFNRPTPPSGELHLEITTPPTTDLTSLAISPDGKHVAFVAMASGVPRLWVRSISDATLRNLPGTDNASYPFWSPDSRSLGFFANLQLKAIDLDSGSVQALAKTAGNPLLGGAWSRDGTILFNTGPDSALFRVPATGGQTTAVTKTDSQVAGHLFPQFLPGGRHFLFYGFGAAGGLYIGQMDTSEPPRRILENVQAATYASPGRILFVRQRTLFAQEIDLSRFELRGTPRAVAQQIVLGTQAGSAAVAASASGAMIFRTGPGDAQVEFVWLDRSGKELGKVAGSDFSGRASASLSSDDNHVTFERIVSGDTTTDVWQLDVRRPVPRRITSDPGFDIYPIWSADGRQIAFSSLRNGTWDVFVKPVDGIGGEQAVVATDQFEVTQGDWSPDGRFLLYASSDPPRRGFDIYAVPLTGDRKPFPVADTTAAENRSQFSPDGKWIAFESNESGRSEIYVQAFPGPAPKSQVTGDGGTQVRWRRDGRELLYLSQDQRLMSVPITADSKRQSVEIGTPTPLFAVHLAASAGGWQYMVSRDGQRILVDALKEVTVPITVVLNWAPQP